MAATDDGSCIEPVLGCTLTNGSLYEGVALGTPNVRSAFVGSPRRGLVAWPDARAVLNHDPRANVLQGCVLAIEGCMDSRALNYDPDATVDSADWCVLPRRGCMLPGAHDGAASLAPNASVAHDGAAAAAAATATAAAAAAFPRAHWLDGLGLATNYDPSATVHDATFCALERRGCLASSALNYDPHATVPGPCYEPVLGCLEPRALNFGCSLNVTTHDLLADGEAAALAAAANVTMDAAMDAAAAAERMRPLLSPTLCLSPPAVASSSSSSSSPSSMAPTAIVFSATAFAVLPATIHSSALCAYPPPPPYALYAGLGVLGLALLASLVVYLRRRSAKVDVASAVALASDWTHKLHTRGLQPASTAMVRALAATATALPERQTANTYREVLKLRRKLAAASEAAGAAARLASEVDTLRGTAEGLRGQLEVHRRLQEETQADLGALRKRFDRLTSTHDEARHAHQQAASEAAASLASLEETTRRQCVSMAALTTALSAVEADLATSEIAAAQQQSAADAAAASAARTLAKMSAADAAVRAALSDADLELGASVAAYQRCSRACTSAEASEARAAAEARVLACSVAVGEDEVLTTARALRQELEAAQRAALAVHAAQMASQQREHLATVEGLRGANQQLSIQVQSLEASSERAFTEYEMQIEALTSRITSLDEAASGLRAEQSAAQAAARATEAALEREKAAAAIKLETELKRLEDEKARETWTLQQTVNKMQKMQATALAAGSARGRQMLYAETLKQRRAQHQGSQQALHELPRPLAAPATPPPPVKWKAAAAGALDLKAVVAAGWASAGGRPPPSLPWASAGGRDVVAQWQSEVDEEAALSSPEPAATGDGGELEAVV